MDLSFLSDYEKAFDDFTKILGKSIKESIFKTETDIGRKMTDDELKLCVELSVLFAFIKYL